MNRLALGLSTYVLLITGCISADDKYIGEYTLGENTLTLSTDGKCNSSYPDLSCKWNAEKKEIILNTGKQDIQLNIVSINDDILTIFNPDKGTTDKLFKKNGTHWNKIIGEYKCPGFLKYIKLNNDGSFEGGARSGKWVIIKYLTKTNPN